MTDRRRLPAIACILGFAGLLPQAAAVAVLIVGGTDVRFAALSLAYAYAALIFSFLDGLWWGLAAAARSEPPRWTWIMAVLLDRQSMKQTASVRPSPATAAVTSSWL